MATQSRVPPQLKAGIAALMIAMGGGMPPTPRSTAKPRRCCAISTCRPWPQTRGTSEAVKIAMVMGAYYESSYKHIGTPYVDKLGKRPAADSVQRYPQTWVVQGRYRQQTATDWSVRGTSQVRNASRKSALPAWDSLHRLGAGYGVGLHAQQRRSGVRQLHHATQAARRGCGGRVPRNVRWNKGAVNGVSTVPPGLKVRGDANAEICEGGAAMNPIFGPCFGAGGVGGNDPALGTRHRRPGGRCLGLLGAGWQVQGATQANKSPRSSSSTQTRRCRPRNALKLTEHYREC